MSKNKNRSKTIKNGTILQTRDEYLHGQQYYRKIGWETKGNYRKVTVIDSNRNDELAVVKLYSKSGTALPSGKSHYKPFVETLDDKNRRIRIGRKFISNGKSLSKQDVAAIKRDCFTNPKYRYKNKKIVKRLKSRK